MRAPRLHSPTAAEQTPRHLPLLAQLSRDVAAASTPEEVANAAIAAIAQTGEHDAAFITQTGATQPWASFGPALSDDPAHWLIIPLTSRGCQLAALSHHRGDGAATATDFLHSLACFTGLALDNIALSQDLAQHTGFRDELALVAELQRNLLPPPRPEPFPVFGLNRPIRQISGDFFDFFVRPDGLIPFALGDVSGKGLNAALLMAKTTSLFHCLAKTIDEPADLLQVINREICDTASRGMFVTMVAGIYDPAKGRVSFANAGHEPPLIRLPDRSYRSFPADAPPLGILPGLAIQTTEANLERGEFYIFSDGLTEFRYDNQEDLGVDGLIQLIESKSNDPLRTRLEALLSDLDGDGWEVRDDLTILAIDDSLGGASR